MMKTFSSDNLIKLRQARFWTQEDLSAASGVSVRTVQRMEQGKSASIASWKAIASAFNVPLETFEQSLEMKKVVTISQRQAAINVTIGCAGGLFGCSFGWWAIMSATPDFHGAVTDFLPLTALVTLATAVCLIVPCVQWQRFLE